MAPKILFVTTVLLTGLVAGLFYSFSFGVNLGLGRLSDLEYLRAMQSINREILNPWFFTGFFGALATLVGCVWFAHEYFGNHVFLLVVGALVLYTFGVMAVTILGNVPLNEALDKLDLNTMGHEQLRGHRRLFEEPWNRLNTIRTMAAIGAFVLMVLALIKMEW